MWWHTTRALSKKSAVGSMAEFFMAPKEVLLAGYGPT
jgi:hypothetical protein